METFCTTSRHSKYRPTLNSNSFYQASTYSRNFRQNEYCFANSARNSTLLWHERPHPTVVKSKGKYCSIALAVSASVVLLAVISIVGLALHIGALKNEPSNALMSYSCSAKVARGDRFATNLSEKARRYRIQLESLYQSSILGPALVSCTVEKFGNDSLTIYFKINLSRKKIPKQIHNIEKTIKDILLNDALSKKSVFQFVRFEPRSVTVKQMMDFESYQRVITKPKELPKARLGASLKLPNKTQITLTTGLPVKKKAVIEEIDIKEEDLPVIQGSFKISKTEADITEKKSNRTLETSTQKTTTQVPRRPTLKETSVTSALFKLASSEKTTKSPTTITATSPTPITSQITTTTTSTTTEYLSTKQAQINPVLFSVSPSIFNEEPWVPIYHLPKETFSEISPVVQPTQQKEIKSNQPVYTSFTNPGLSFHSMDSEKLGATKLRGHPIPVKKIPDITESFIWETTTDVSHTTIPPIQTSEVTPNDSQIKSDSFETDRQQSAVLKNISSIFHSLASSLGIAPIYFQGVKKTSTQNIETTTQKIEATEEPVTTTRFVEEEIIKNAEVTKEPISGEGLAEVVDIDESSLILHTTNVPLVTLLPVKSNSGVGRPIRPRPETRNETVSGNRSFPSDSSKLNVNTDEFTKSPIKYVETEVVTSISSKLNKVKVDKNQSNYKIVSVLNFETEASPLREHEPTPSSAIIFNKEVEAPVYDHQISFLNMNFTPPTDKGDFYLSPEKLSQLSVISKLSDNNTSEAVISTKAVSSSYTINHSGFKILTKTYNKIPSTNKEVANKSSGIYSTFYIDITNKSECSNFTVKCGDGTCLPETTRCNQLVDCNDGSDEKDCNCADYLRSQFLLRKICDGIVDCWDFSDENHCDWCSPGQYVCGNSKSCINRTNICDGVRDCPLGDDERQCVTVAPNLNAADEFPYYSEGYLLIRKHGRWGKLCVDNFNDVMSKSKTSWEISDLGQAVCKAMTYQSLDTVKIFLENKSKSVFKNSHYFELTYSHRNESKSSLTFENTTCSSGEVVKVKCNSLECGARPQVSKQLSRIVGGGNAGLGAWPWQAALYKEGEFQCGATLISDKWLMSAGHCFYHSLDEHWVARLGALRRGTSLPSPYEQLRPIAQIILHPNYVDNGFINDISLLKMQTAVTFSDYVRPICLPPAGVAPKDGRICTVIGWGQLFEIGRIFPDTLQEVQVPVISTAECRKRTLFLPLYRVTDDMFCAGYDRGGRDACLGDSGGPLMCPESDGRWVLHGITSNGYGCARAYRPGVYTKVSNYITWINTHLYKLDNNSTAVKDSCPGHRCPLGECLPKSNLCNGFIECSDGSDEVECLNN